MQHDTVHGIGALLAFVVLVSQTVAEDPALRGHWPLRADTGRRAVDKGPHHRDGAITPGATWVETGDGAVLDFDGGGGRVEIPHDPALVVTDALTVEAWVAVRSKGQTAPIVGKGGQAYAKKHFQLFLGNHGTLWQFSVSDGTQPLAVSAGVAELLTWVHLVGTWQRSTSTACIYKNGVLAAKTRSEVGDFATEEPLRIGGQDHGIDGVISDVRIYARVLTAAEVKASFDGGSGVMRGDPAALFAERRRDEAVFETVGEIACEGTYPAHIQGLDTDGARIYWSFTTTLVKTDLQGRVEATASVPYHHGGITVTENEVFAAFMPGRKIKVYSADGLSFLREYDVPEVRGFPGGIDYHDGHFYVAEGTRSSIFPEVYKYDTRFNHVKTFTIPLNVHIGIQTIGRFGNTWWLGIYDKAHPTVMLDDDFGVLATRHDLPAAYGVKDWSAATMITGVHLGKDKTCMGKALLRRLVKP